MKTKPQIKFVLKGLVERGTGEPGYRSTIGYSQLTEDGKETCPWQTRREAQATAAAAGARAIFIDDRGNRLS